MAIVKLMLSSRTTRKWHHELATRLASRGHEVSVAYQQGYSPRETILNLILMFERLLFRGNEFRLADPSPRLPPNQTSRMPEVVVDLSGRQPSQRSNCETLSILLDRGAGAMEAAVSLCRGVLPVIDAYRGDQHIDRAAPMVDSRISLSRGLNDVFARAITLTCKHVDGVSGSTPETAASTYSEGRKSGSMTLMLRYLSFLFPRLIGRAVRRLRYYGGHWRVGYRFIDGPGVVDTGSLEGVPWSVLPDGGDRFYADPFPFEWQGKFYIFVEELIHANGKGVISVAESGQDGSFTTPKRVLEEAYHLSYPQVFSWGSEIWMIPESGAGRQVTLYRAREFPTVWERHCVLIPDQEIFDATLIDHDGFLWLVGTVRDGGGSASDTMVVYSAADLAGPWQPHPMNPILIDRAAARPGGRAVARSGRLVLPLQDGTKFYGGGLGLASLTRLDHDRVEISSPLPIDVGSDPWLQHIHTLNRCGPLETIDYFSDKVKRC